MNRARVSGECLNTWREKSAAKQGGEIWPPLTLQTLISPLPMVCQGQKANLASAYSIEIQIHHTLFMQMRWTVFLKTSLENSSTPVWAKEHLISYGARKTVVVLQLH